MIHVKLEEQPRTYKVYLGSKLVGNVHVYQETGGCAAYVLVDPSRPDGGRFIDAFDTLRQATNAILEHLGFGRMVSGKGPGIRRAKGGRLK